MGKPSDNPLMRMVEQNHTILMLRPNLEAIAMFQLPEGYSIRWYREGDERLWLDIHREAEKYVEITDGMYQREFGHDPKMISEHQCFLLDPAGEAIGTATAWFDPNFRGECIGRVHWVAIRPDWQGRSLAKPLMSTVLQRLRDLGHPKAYLRTSTGRIPAICLYYRFGFEPDRTEADQGIIWDELMQCLDMQGINLSRY